MKADLKYSPQIGLGTFKFGMSREDVVGQLGQPQDEVLMADAAPWPDDVLEYVSDRVVLTYRAGKSAYQEYLLFKGELVEITLHNAATPVEFNGVDLFAKDRMNVIVNLLALEDSFFVNSEDLWFPKSGIIFSVPDCWGNDGDKAVSFRLTSYENQPLAFSDWEELTDVDDI